ncbi:hypothetical protein BTVI_94407 [Pitangus sulphuratus]|nr:hypothetical protein BTVI_94407 [Pitangus sulphuratus]
MEISDKWCLSGVPVETSLISSSMTESRIKCTFSKFPNNTNLCSVAHMPEGRYGIHDLGKPEMLFCVSFMRFNKTKHKDLHLGWGNTQYQYRLSEDRFESSLVKKGLGVLVDENPSTSWQSALTTQKANCIPGCIKSIVASKSREETEMQQKHMQVNLRLSYVKCWILSVHDVYPITILCMEIEMIRTSKLQNVPIQEIANTEEQIVEPAVKWIQRRERVHRCNADCETVEAIKILKKQPGSQNIIF